MSDRLADIAEVAADVNFTIQDDVTGTMNEEAQLKIRGRLLDLIHKIGLMTGYDIDVRNVGVSFPLRISLVKETLDGQDQSGDSSVHAQIPHNTDALDESFNYYESVDQLQEKVNDQATIAPAPKSKRVVEEEQEEPLLPAEGYRHMSVQTAPLPFGPVT